MEAEDLYKRFHHNVMAIADVLNSKVELRTMPYDITIPLEVKRLSELLKLHGVNIPITATGYDAFWQLKQQYEQHEAAITDAIRTIMQDKRSIIQTPEGKYFQKEEMIRRLEFFNETAHTLEVMMAQQKLKSPKHFTYTFTPAEPARKRK